MYNNDLTVIYDKTTSAFYERNSDGTRGDEIVISPIKRIQKGTIKKTDHSVSIPLTGFTNLNKMIYLITGTGIGNFTSGEQEGYTGINCGNYATLTLTSLTITSTIPSYNGGGTFSYQVIEFN